jgi:Icc-related predicted phosphoesterase
MRILVVSDLHGDLACVHRAIAHFAPDALLCCGDWGDPDEVSDSDLAAFPARLPTLTTFGNHDAIERLRAMRNRDGSRVLFEQGEVRTLDGLRIGAIGGIWAKSHRQPFYVTDEDVAGFATQIAAQGAIDVLMTHGCPIGMADRTEKGNHGGQRCFLQAFQATGPKVHLCGHLHVAQEHRVKDGRLVLNVGATPAGSVVVLESAGEGLSAAVERFQP